MDKKITNRIATIRIRTVCATLSILIALTFYLLIDLATQQVNWKSFSILCFIQIVTYIIYFPDGELFGQKNERYIANKKAYDDRANAINANREIKYLRKYCKVDFERRKHAYILSELGALGITEDDFECIKKMGYDKIDSLINDNKQMEINGTLVLLNRQSKKRLKRLLENKIPVEENHYETIMSAVERDDNLAISDTSIKFRYKAYISKIFMAVVVGAFFAYVGFSKKDGIGIAEIAELAMFLCTMITNAVMSYSQGERNTTIHKTQFYIDLCLFIDGFNEWKVTDEEYINKNITE